MTDQTLRPCPFCGDIPECEHFAIVPLGILFSPPGLVPEDFNIRPLEDKLREENEKLVRAIGEHVAVRTRYYQENDKLRAENERLKEDLKNADAYSGALDDTLEKFKAQLAKAKEALKFYTDTALFDPEMDTLSDGTKVTVEHWAKKAKETLKELGE